jgi:threonylcarbamoyladenosine tRNA methylthiotransferase MtaB
MICRRDEKKMKVAFHTLGCKVNQYETEAMREQFTAAGHEVVDENDIADAYIINTCTVTGLADRKSRQYIRRMKKKSPGSIVAVTGCYVQIKPDEVAAIDGVDIIAGTNEKDNILGYIEAYSGAATEQENDAERHVLSYDELDEYRSSGIITSMESRTRAYIKIEDGCDRFCSYCVIPYARGPVRSRPADEIIEEAESLVGRGFKELILTGINTALYNDLPGLLKRMDEMDGDFRVRLSSLEPTVVNAEYVKGLLRFRRLCHHLHLSLQSGSDAVLKAMRRRYDMKEYLDIVDVLREADPLYGISTDIIAGFPGETDEDIACSVSCIEKIGFCKTHAFNYSQRPGTVAAAMSGQVAPPLRKQRVGMLIEAGDTAQTEFARANIGTENTVLFEERPVKDNGCLMAGYTDNYLRAYAEYDEKLLGQLVRVRISDTFEDGVLCEVKYEAM